MKKFKGVWGLLLTAFVLAIMVAPVNAQITQSTTGVGDALIFPFIDADLGNTIVITNEGNQWMQVHVRVRTGGQSVEGRDFPLILSPGDMAVFGISRAATEDDPATADVKEDLWSINYKMDPNNFKYVRMNQGTGAAVSLYDLAEGVGGLINSFEILEPTTGWGANQKAVDKKYGYVEVIGEAVFVEGLAKVGSELVDGPTNTVRYIAAGFHLADVPNVLSGKAYVGSGMAYNAIAFTDFRTNDPAVTHRVENYVALDGSTDTAVIVTSEDSYINDAAADDYTYNFTDDQTRATAGGDYEAMVSANNSWGPTLADGDSYLGDDLDLAWNIENSVREVETAIREVSVRGHYLNDTGNFETRLVVMFPTKHHIAESIIDFQANRTSFDNWKIKYDSIVNLIKPTYEAEIWNIDEVVIIPDVDLPPFTISPRPEVDITTYPDLRFEYEVNVFAPTTNLDKSIFSAGRFVLKNFKDTHTGQGLVTGGMLPVLGMSFTEGASGFGNMTTTQY